jgi:hypothetical protein
MAKKLTLHPYSDRQSFQRLMLLIATLICYPDIGDRNLKAIENSNILEIVKQKLRELADSISIQLPDEYPAIPTLRKDLEILREYKILDRRMYRHGYYVGTGVMTKAELKMAFNALESQAIYQGDPNIRRVYDRLSQRLRGFEFEDGRDFFYPVRQNLNRSINYTDPQEMMEKGKYRHTLFHQIDKIERAILTRSSIEISRKTNLYGDRGLGIFAVIPLQLIYYDIAWYLLYESCYDGCLAIGRMNRLADYCEFLTQPTRDIETQKQSLNNAYKLLKNGWGLKLGNKQEQELELQGKLPLVKVKVRFFPPASDFIQEGELRHPKQKLKLGTKDLETGKPKYIDYAIDLPARSLEEFSIWVQRYFDKAQILSPSELVEKHYNAALTLVEKYKLQQPTEN